MTDRHTHMWPSILMGRISIECAALPADLQHKVHATFDGCKMVQPILDIAEAYTSMPLCNMENTLKNSIKYAGDGVAKTFFDENDFNLKIAENDFTSLRNDMAICMMAKGIAQVSKHDFDKTINVSAANKKLKDLIHSKEAISLGRELLVQDLIDHHGFQKYLNNKQHWVEKLEHVLLDEVYIIGTVVKEIAEENNLSVKMKIFMLKELGSKKVYDVLKKWEEICDKKMVKAVHDFLYTDNHLLDISAWMDSAFQDKVKSACLESHSSSWREYPMMPQSSGIYTQHTEVTYGASVRSWLGEDATRRLNLRTSKNPNNIIKQQQTKSVFSCFLPDTLVALASGESITIQHLKENNHILGNHGLVGTISSETVEVVIEDKVAIFGFNHEEPFFTASHPFWTQHGWRAVDPHGAKDENSWLEVGQLSAGDHVRKIKSYQSGKVKYEWVEVTDIHCKTFPAGTRVYGVHTREGPRSYHANGYLVFENYPEITAQRVVENMAGMSIPQQLKMTEHLKMLQPTLSKLIGEGAAKSMAAIAKNHLEHKLSNGNRSNRLVPLKEVCLSRVNLHYQTGRTKHGEYKMPESLALLRGHLFVDGKHVVHSHSPKDDKVTWTRPVSTGHWEHGTVKLHHGRLSGHGYVSLTKNHADTKSLASANFTAAVNENTYKCYRSIEPETDGTSTISKWEDFGGLIMGTDFSSGECKTIGKIKIPPAMDEYYDFGNSVTFTSDDKYQLHVNVNLTSNWRSVVGYCKLTGVFSADFSSFSGYCVEYDVTAPGYEGKKYAWKGIIEKNPETVSMMKVAKKKNMLKAVHHQKKAFQAFDAVDGSTSTSNTTPMARTTSNLTDSSLSIDNLYTLTPPDMDAVHTLTFSYLQEGMKYEMTDDNRENILGVAKPSPSGELATACDKYKAFLGTRFANAYCMYGLSQSSHFEKTITEEERNKLLFYFNGADTGCLSADADYNKVNNEFSRVAYLESCPDLEKYLKSSEGGEYWAKKLYGRLTEQQVLNGLAAQAESAQTLAIIQKQSMVLFCLAPDQDYGSKFYKQILTTKLNQMSTFFQGDPDNDDVMKQVFQDSIHQLVLLILSQSDETSGPATQQLQKTLSEAMKELSIEATTSAEETASAIVSHMEDIVSSCITAMNAKTGNSWEALITSLNNFFGEHYKWKAFGYLAGSLMFQAMWGVSLFFSVKMFMQWKQLKPEQQVALVIDTVQMTLDVVNKVPGMIAGFKDCVEKKKVTFKFMEIWEEGNNRPEVIEGIEMVMERGVEEEVGTDFSEAIFNEEFANAATKTATELEENVSLWTKVFNFSEGLADALGFVGSLAGCVVIGFQIFRDFKEGAPVAQKALDICQGVTLAVATVATAAGLFVEMACLPIIGIACAIIGIAFAIGSLFIKRDPPKPKPTKIDIYVKDQGKPAVDKLPAPSDEWLKEYKKKQSETKD